MTFSSSALRSQRLFDRTRMAILTTLLAAGCSMTGCMVGPKYRPPSSNLAPFHNAPAIDSRSAIAPAPPLDAWWTGFRDPDLNRIVQRALDQNLDLAAAVSRVVQSRAIARQLGAANKPQANLTAQDMAERQSLQSEFGKVGSYIPNFKRNENYYDLGISASWELDLFGQLKGGAIAAKDEAQAAQAQQAGTRISVAADAANAYFEVRGDQQRIAFAINQVETDEHLVKLVRQRFEAGVASDRELAQAEAVLAQAKASLPTLRIALEAQLNRLDVLMGAQPGTYAAELSQARPIPDIPAVAGFDNSVDTLRRRPDVIAAERRVAASNARIGAALAGYYPTISLTGVLGYESVTPGSLLRSSTFQPQEVAGLRWRIFDFGRVSAEVAQARGADGEALINYRETMLRAAEDVENAFMNLSQSESRESELILEANALRRARDRSQEAYTAGTIAVTDVLDADRQLLVAQDDLASTRANAAEAAVSSFRAIGGGWTPPLQKHATNP